MIILIPLGGTGERFKSDGYILPKALIPVNNKPILFYLLDNICMDKITTVLIPYNKEYIIYNLENLLNVRYPLIKFQFVPLDNNTRGAADTIRIALNQLETHDCPLLCLDGDNFYTTDIISLWNGENVLLTFADTANDPIYSYITTNKYNHIESIMEKEKISDIACCGSYGFQSWKQCLHYINFTIDKAVTQKNEYYVSSIIQEMIKNHTFKNVIIQNKQYFSLGTPKQIKEYEYSFLFDLDGTLVNTDYIYTEVWNIIFKEYNFGFTIDMEFFNQFIKGKNDSFFLNYLLPNIDKQIIMDISKKKDEIFISLLKNKESSILLPGVLEFMEKNKNRQMAIVTSCNRKSAEYILNKTGLNNYITLLIASEDCNRHKPDPEPYLKAIEQLGLIKEKTIIFEDSYSGYTSAKNAQVYKIILICNEDSCLDIKQTSEYKIPNYVGFDISTLLFLSEDKELESNTIEQRINDCILLYFPLKKNNTQSSKIKNRIYM